MNSIYLDQKTIMHNIHKRRETPSQRIPVEILPLPLLIPPTVVMLGPRRRSGTLVMLVAFLLVFFPLFPVPGPTPRSSRAFRPRAAAGPFPLDGLRRSTPAHAPTARFFLLGLFAFAFVMLVLSLFMLAVRARPGPGAPRRAVVLLGANADQHHVIVIARENLGSGALRRDRVYRSVGLFVLVFAGGGGVF